MAKTRCNFCWAKGSGGQCMCNEETRWKHCEKAIKRAQADAITKNKELIGIRKYLTYLKNRIIYLKIFSSHTQSNEYKYCCCLRKSIKQWGEEHIVFYKYLCGKISPKEAIALYGVSERTFNRIATQQRKDLIEFIENQEKVLSEIYPFLPMELMDSNSKTEV